MKQCTPESQATRKMALSPIKLVSRREESWAEMLKELKSYKARFGDCLVPTRYPPNRKLGNWVMTQRRQYMLARNGSPSTLTKTRKKSLEKIGFAWFVKENKDDAWSRRYHDLVQYKAINGNCCVPQIYPPNPSLGTWVCTQRKQYKLHTHCQPSGMTRERIRALNLLGFEWTFRDARAVAGTNALEPTREVRLPSTTIRRALSTSNTLDHRNCGTIVTNDCLRQEIWSLPEGAYPRQLMFLRRDLIHKNICVLYPL